MSFILICEKKIFASVLSSRWRKRGDTDFIDAEEEKEDEEEAAARSESTGRQPLLASKNIYQLLYMFLYFNFHQTSRPVASHWTAKQPAVDDLAADRRRVLAVSCVSAVSCVLAVRCVLTVAESSFYRLRSSCVHVPKKSPQLNYYICEESTWNNRAIKSLRSRTGYSVISSIHKLSFGFTVNMMPD